MKLPFTFFVGLRYTSARRKNQLVSFLSGISITGLVVGVALLVAVLSVINGFERELQEKILGLIPQAVIKNYSGIDDWKGLQAQLERDPEIIAAAPYIQQNALLNYKRLTEPVALYAIEPAAELRVSNISDFIDVALLEQLSEETPSVVLGVDIAKKLKTKAGKKVMLVVPGNTGAASPPKVAYFTVLALVKTGTELDNGLVLTAIRHARPLSDKPHAITGMRLRLSDIFQAPQIVYRNLVALGAGYSGNNWMRTHGNLSHSIKMSKGLVGLLMSLIVAIALFNVVSTLVMVVIDKRGDIAILRTLGASTSKIMAVFMVQGCAIGLIGTAIGMLLGCLLALGIQDLVGLVEQLFNTQFLKSDVYPVTYLPAEIRAGDLFKVGVTALTMSFIATLYPAWRASRVQPAEALRYE